MTNTVEEALDSNSSEITISYNEGPPASGKSEYLKRLMLDEPGRYLLAVPTQRLLSEQTEGPDGLRMRFAAAGLPSSAEVITISSATHTRSVRRALVEAGNLYRYNGHVVVVCTHAALMTSDLSAFAGWTLLIDEVPNIVACDTWKTGGSVAQFEANYRLLPVVGSTTWSRVAVRTDAPGAAAIASDDLINGLAAFHRRALSRSGVYVNLSDWVEMESGEN
jgi:hypothetical protein